MDIPVNTKRINDADNEVGRIESDKESIKKALHSAIENVLDDETLQAIQDMIEKRKNAMEQIDKERRSLLKKIVEEQKKAIQGNAIGAMQEEIIKPKTIKENVERVRIIKKSVISEGNTNQVLTVNNQDKAACVEEMTLEILPPRDPNAITIINNYLTTIPEVLNIELDTLADKSVFKLKLREPVNLIEKLRSLPQVLDAEQVFEFRQKKIKISLTCVFI